MLFPNISYFGFPGVPGAAAVLAAASAPVARLGTACIPLLLVSLLSQPAGAQQMVTDDAAIVDARACQLEAWHGEVQSWVRPACQFVDRLETELGLGWIEEGNGHEMHGALQLKLLLREMTPGRTGVGIVAGVESGFPLASPSLAYAYVPLSRAIADERLILHLNLGWQMERDLHGEGEEAHAHRHHALAWAARADLLLPGTGERFSLLGELFGEDRARPALQLGLRAELISDRLASDLTWGGHIAPSETGPGWTLGLAWTPRPLR